MALNIKPLFPLPHPTNVKLEKKMSFNTGSDDQIDPKKQEREKNFPQDNAIAKDHLNLASKKRLLNKT